MAMRAELVKTDIALCWNLREGEIPAQKRDSPFADVIVVLDEYAWHQPSGCEWDELVHPPPLAPHHSHHLSHVLGQIVDMDNTMLAYRFYMMEPNRELVGVMRQLIFEGYLLHMIPCTI